MPLSDEFASECSLLSRKSHVYVIATRRPRVVGAVSVCAQKAAAMPVGHQFNPYTSNGGSILAIHGEDYCVIAGDTRQSEGYNIQTRHKPKVFRLCVASLTQYGQGDACHDRICCGC